MRMYAQKLHTHINELESVHLATLQIKEYQKQILSINLWDTALIPSHKYTEQHFIHLQIVFECIQ